MSLKGGKGGMRCPIKSQRKVWLVALSEMLESQRNLMILFKDQSFTPNEFYCFIVSHIFLLFLAYFICLSFTVRKTGGKGDARDWFHHSSILFY
jgi:hypothetical protein